MKRKATVPVVCNSRVMKRKPLLELSVKPENATIIVVTAGPRMCGRYVMYHPALFATAVSPWQPCEHQQHSDRHAMPYPSGATRARFVPRQSPSCSFLRQDASRARPPSASESASARTSRLRAHYITHGFAHQRSSHLEANRHDAVHNVEGDDIEDPSGAGRVI